MDQERTEKPIRLCLSLRKNLFVLYGVISERSFGRKNCHTLSGPPRIDEIDEVDSNA